ncbi:class E sortase, partial [Streptomyces albogriseolus]
MTALRPEREDSYGTAYGSFGVPGAGAPYGPLPDDETMALRLPEAPEEAQPYGRPLTAPDGPSAPHAPVAPGGGRAARRKAAKRRHGRRGGPGDANGPQEPPGRAAGDGRPLSRVEARRR